MSSTHGADEARLDPLVDEGFDTAHETFAELRQACPVVHSDAFGGFWSLLKYDDVVAALTDPTRFITSEQNVVPKVAFTGRRPPLHLDPPEHTPYRQVINRFFTSDAVDQLRPRITSISRDLIGEYVAAGGGDLCEEVTHRFPGHVLAEFFNVPTELGLEMREVTARYNGALQEARDELVKTTSRELYSIAERMIELRRERPLPPEEDLVSALLAARWQGEPLPADLVLGTIRQMIVVGMIAPSVFIGTVAVHLAEHPDLQARLRGDLGLVPAAVEEYLRLFTPYRGFARTAIEDVEFRGRTIRAGEPIALVFASANRDEEVFEDPDSFVLHRPNLSRHIAFGLGPHRCAGEALARLMLVTIVGELLSATSSIEVDGDVEMTRWPEWGTLRVPLRVLA